MAAFQQRLQANPHYNTLDPIDRAFGQQLKANIFAKTRYWVEQVKDALPAGLYRKKVEERWQQRHRFRKYSWGRFFLADYPDEGFYITLGVDSGETGRAHSLTRHEQVPAGPSLILKIDMHGPTGSLPAPRRYADRLALFAHLPLQTRWRRIGPEALATYTWPRLIAESVAFLTEHEAPLRQLWEEIGHPNPLRNQTAQLLPGRNKRIREGQVPVIFPRRETEANDFHRRLSNALQDLLPSAGYTDVQRSRPIAYPAATGKPRNEVDLVAVSPAGHLTFFEIKALDTVDSGIREAMGQLLEYAYWAAPTPALATKLVIATPHPLSADARQYLHRLQEEFALSLNYVQIKFDPPELVWMTA